MSLMVNMDSKAQGDEKPGSKVHRLCATRSEPGERKCNVSD
jgi:hypothetical protein